MKGVAIFKNNINNVQFVWNCCSDFEEKPVRKGGVTVSSVVLPSIQLECVSLVATRRQPRY